MKKILAVSAITAAVIFTGCWDSSNGGMSAPDFATKSAVLNDVNDTAKALATLSVFEEENNIVEFSKNNKLNPEFATKIMGKDTKFAKKVKSSIEKMTAEAEESCENDRVVEEFGCSEGGKITVIGEIKPAPQSDKICNLKVSVRANKCKWFNNDKNMSGYSNGLVEMNFKIINNGEFLSINFIENFVETHKYLDENNKTKEEKDYNLNAKVSAMIDYKVENNGSITVGNKISSIMKGYGKYEANKIDVNSSEKTLEELRTFKANFTQIKELKDENKDHYVNTYNGWIDEYYKKLESDSNYTELRNGIAAKNLVIEQGEVNDSVEFEIINGKAGSTCTKGMVDFKTLNTLHGMEQDEFPYEGKMSLSGANNTKATVTFSKDENNNTHAFVDVAGDGNKTYNSWDEIEEDANLTGCMPDMPELDEDLVIYDFFDWSLLD